MYLVNSGHTRSMVRKGDFYQGGTALDRCGQCLLYFESTLIDNVKSRVSLQGCGNADALGRLVILEQGGDNARQSQCRAVQGVAQVRLLVIATIAALEAVGLIGLEVGN